jgi:lipopolysaccharide/colanic/teichoic acid biosynthesis glycosyltransferase
LAVALLLGVPVLAFTTVVVWFLQRWQSPGPVFIRQVRSGLYRKKFWMFKYRTMHVNNGDQARQATRNDSLIFPAGRWLRRFSIDELPQFINVLRGDMSVVGPRPHLLEHDDVFARVLENYHVRAAVKPGVTGLAQVRGYRGQVTSEDAIRKRIQSDIYYLENWSFALDCSIIARTTVQLIFPPKSAY